MRRLPLGAGRRRSERHRNRDADDGDPALQVAQGRERPRTALHHTSRKETNRSRRGRLLRHDRSRPRPLQGRPAGDPLHDRLPVIGAQHDARTSLLPVRRGGRFEDQRDRGCAQLDRIGLSAVEHLQETEGCTEKGGSQTEAKGESKGEEENEAVGSSVTRVFVIASSSGAAVRAAVQLRREQGQTFTG